MYDRWVTGGERRGERNGRREEGDILGFQFEIDKFQGNMGILNCQSSSFSINFGNSD